MPGSREGLKVGQQRYATIEFCNDPEALFGKLASGRYDWLGTKQDKKGRLTFIVGTPRQSRGLEVSASITLARRDADGRHRTETITPKILLRGQPLPTTHYPTPEQARDGFEEKLDRRNAQELGGSAIAKLRLYVDNTLEREEFVVHAVPNVL